MMNLIWHLMTYPHRKSNKDSGNLVAGTALCLLIIMCKYQEHFHELLLFPMSFVLLSTSHTDVMLISENFQEHFAFVDHIEKQTM